MGRNQPRNSALKQLISRLSERGSTATRLHRGGHDYPGMTEDLKGLALELARPHMTLADSEHMNETRVSNSAAANGHLRRHKWLLQSTTRALTPRLEKLLGLRTKARLNEHPERHEIATGQEFRRNEGRRTIQ